VATGELPGLQSPHDRSQGLLGRRSTPVGAEPLPGCLAPDAEDLPSSRLTSLSRPIEEISRLPTPGDAEVLDDCGSVNFANWCLTRGSARPPNLAAMAFPAGTEQLATVARHTRGSSSVAARRPDKGCELTDTGLPSQAAPRGGADDRHAPHPREPAAVGLGKAPNVVAEIAPAAESPTTDEMLEGVRLSVVRRLTLCSPCGSLALTDATPRGALVSFTTLGDGRHPSDGDLKQFTSLRFWRL
jgi:hypothetical protein